MDTPYFVSRHFLNSDFPQLLSVDNAITIYADQVHSWFLDVAERLTKDVEADFVVLMVITAYFEGYEIYRRGEDSKGRNPETKESKSREFFRAAFKEIVPVCIEPSDTNKVNPGASDTNREDAIDEIATMLYDQMRCGFFHAGMTRPQVSLSRGALSNPRPPVLAKKCGSEWRVVINVPALLEVVKAHFRGYLSQLRDSKNREAREKFAEGWRLRVTNKGLPDEKNPLIIREDHSQ